MPVLFKISVSLHNDYCLKRTFLQKLCPQGALCGLSNTSWQIEQ